MQSLRMEIMTRMDSVAAMDLIRMEVMDEIQMDSVEHMNTAERNAITADSETIRLRWIRFGTAAKAVSTAVPNFRKARENRMKSQQDLIKPRHDAIKAQQDLMKACQDLRILEHDAIKAQQDMIKAQQDAIEAQQDAIKAQQDAIHATCRQYAFMQAAIKAQQAARKAAQDVVNETARRDVLEHAAIKSGDEAIKARDFSITEMLAWRVAIKVQIDMTAAEEGAITVLLDAITAVSEARQNAEQNLAAATEESAARSGVKRHLRGVLLPTFNRMEYDTDISHRMHAVHRVEYAKRSKTSDENLTESEEHTNVQRYYFARVLDGYMSVRMKTPRDGSPPSLIFSVFPDGDDRTPLEVCCRPSDENGLPGTTWGLEFSKGLEPYFTRRASPFENEHTVRIKTFVLQIHGYLVEKKSGGELLYQREYLSFDGNCYRDRPTKALTHILCDFKRTICDNVYFTRGKGCMKYYCFLEL